MGQMIDLLRKETRQGSIKSAIELHSIAKEIGDKGLIAEAFKVIDAVLKATSPSQLSNMTEVAIAEKNIVEFAKMAWSIVEKKRDFIPNWHIDAIGEHLEAVTKGLIRRLIICMPPRHMKSLMVSVFWAAWMWTTSPATKMIYSSYAGGLAKRDSLKCRRIIESPWYQLNWGKNVRMAPDQNQTMRFENTATGYRIATSVHGTGTGEGGDIVVSDDAHKVSEADSDVKRNGAITWWDEEMSSRGDDPKTVAHALVGQRVHLADIVGHCMAKGGYEILMLPATYRGKRYVTSIGFVDPRKKVGDLLWPERFGQAEIDELTLRMGPQVASAQLDQEPVTPGGNIIKGKWLDDNAVDELPDVFDQIIIVWDSAHGADKNPSNPKSSFTAGMLIGRVGADYYPIDITRGQWDLPEELASFKAFTMQPGFHRQAIAKVVEYKAHGRAIVQMFEHEIDGIIRFNPTGSKTHRLKSVSPMIQAGNFHILKYSHWVDILKAELCGFPTFPTNDIVDLISMALIHMREDDGEFFMC